MFVSVSASPIAPPESGDDLRRPAREPARVAAQGPEPIVVWKNEILDFLRRRGPTYREWIPARWPVTRLVRDRLVDELVREGAIEMVGGRVGAVGSGRLSAS